MVRASSVVRGINAPIYPPCKQILDIPEKLNITDAMARRILIQEDDGTIRPAAQGEGVMPPGRQMRGAMPGGYAGVPVAPSKAAALDSYLSQGGGMFRASGKFKKGKLRGLTLDEARARFEEMWAAAPDEVKDKYASRSLKTDMAPMERKAAQQAQAAAQRQAGPQPNAKPATVAPPRTDEQKRLAQESVQGPPRSLMDGPAPETPPAETATVTPPNIPSFEDLTSGTANQTGLYPVGDGTRPAPPSAKPTPEEWARMTPAQQSAYTKSTQADYSFRDTAAGKDLAKIKEAKALVDQNIGTPTPLATAPPVVPAGVQGIAEKTAASIPGETGRVLRGMVGSREAIKSPTLQAAPSLPVSAATVTPPTKTPVAGTGRIPITTTTSYTQGAMTGRTAIPGDTVGAPTMRPDGSPVTRINPLTGLPFGYRPGDTVAAPLQAAANASVARQTAASAQAALDRQVATAPKAIPVTAPSSTVETRAAAEMRRQARINANPGTVNPPGMALGRYRDLNQLVASGSTAPTDIRQGRSVLPPAVPFRQAMLRRRPEFAATGR